MSRLWGHGFVVCGLRLWHAVIASGGCIQLLKTHFLAIPALAAPTHAIGVDDASSSATAPWVFTHTNPSRFNSSRDDGRQWHGHQTSCQDFSKRGAW
jgi:hypothetical protein